MLGAVRRFGVSNALRASAPRSLSTRWTSQLLKWQAPSTPSFPAAARSLHASYPALTASAAEARVVWDDSTEPKPITEFSDLAKEGFVNPAIVRNITDLSRMGLKTMTPVQSQTLHEVLGGGDVLAQAKTGTGKTLAFLVPAMQNILNDPSLRKDSIGRYAEPTDTRALIISPTRELAEQIAVEARKLALGTRLQVRTAVGGTQKRSGLEKIQRGGCHLLIGTPGRLKDILSDRRTGVDVPKLNTLILDEADRLLDQGFAPDIMEIQRMLPNASKVDRQTLMFSATVPREVMTMVRRTLKPDFKFVQTIRSDEVPTHLTVPQRSVFLNGYENALPAVLELAKNHNAKQEDDSSLRPFKAIVYFNSTAEVALAAEAFNSLGGRRSRSSPLGPIDICELHSRLSQTQRTQFADNFRRSPKAILFSSDVSARGMDFPDVTHVIQIGVPRDRETYIHRLGRTARAGKKGEGWIFLHNAEYDQFQNLLHQLPIEKDSTSVPAASARMTPLAWDGVEEDIAQTVSLRSETAETIKQVQLAMQNVPRGIKQGAYRSLLSVLSGTIRNKHQLVNVANNTVTIGWGLDTPPALAPSYSQRVGVRRTPGIELGRGVSRKDTFARERAQYDFERPHGRGSWDSDRPRRPSFDTQKLFNRRGATRI